MGQQPSYQLVEGFNHLVPVAQESEGITIYKDPSTQRLYSVGISIPSSQKCVERQIAYFQQREELKSQSLLKLIKFDAKLKTVDCYDQTQIRSIWQHEQLSLKQEIKARAQKGQKFTEPELLKIAEACILSLSEMQTKNIIHEKMTHSAIRFTPSKEVRVVDSLAISELRNIERVKIGESRGLYLSPEECRELEMQMICLKTSKNDVWTVGVLLMEAALLESQEQCYNETHLKINFQEVESAVRKTKSQYSHVISSLIQKMLTRERKNRPTWVQLKQYYQQITSLVLNQRPEKSSVEIRNLGRLHQNNKKSPELFPYKNSIPVENFIPSAVSRVKDQPQIMIHRPLLQAGFGPALFHPNKQNMQYQFVAPPASTQRMGYPVASMGVRSIPGPQFANSKISNSSLKKFASNSSSNGYLFNGPIALAEVQIKEQSMPVKVEETRHVVESRPRQLSSSNRNIIKQAESITYEGDLNLVQLKNFRAQQTNRVLTTIPQIKSEISDKTQEKVVVSQLESNQNNQQLQYVIETFSVGSRYEGQKLRNMRHGRGKFYYQDGGMYDGQWELNKMNGVGNLYYQSNTLAYEGGWKDDQFEGRGKLYNEAPEKLDQCFNYEDFDRLGEHWEHYDGDFHEDLKKGRGKLVLTNGEYYVGEFETDMVHGNGKFFSRNGPVKGRWERNKLVRRL